MPCLGARSLVVVVVEVEVEVGSNVVAERMGIEKERKGRPCRERRRACGAG